MSAPATVEGQTAIPVDRHPAVIDAVTELDAFIAEIAKGAQLVSKDDIADRLLDVRLRLTNVA